MFNFGKSYKKEEQEKKIDSIATISYKIGSDNIVEVDIQVEDYDTNSVSQLCKILDVLSSDSFYMKTLEIIKAGFIKENQQDSLNQIYNHIGNQVSEKIINSINENKKHQPCIKPSQMLK